MFYLINGEVSKNHGSHTRQEEKKQEHEKDELWKKSVIRDTIRHIQDRACTYLFRILASETERGFSTSSLRPFA